jgi:hypothetical protein
MSEKKLRFTDLIILSEKSSEHIPDDKPNNILKSFKYAFTKKISDVLNKYQPEKHYMRGSGPKTKEKEQCQKTN